MEHSSFSAFHKGLFLEKTDVIIHLLETFASKGMKLQQVDFSDRNPPKSHPISAENRPKGAAKEEPAPCLLGVK